MLGVGVMTAVLIAGSVLASSSAEATVLAPTGVTAIRGADDHVTVEWSIPASQGATSYVVSAYTSAGGSVTWDVCGAASGSSTACDPGDSLDVPRTREAWIAVTASDGTSSASSTPRVKVDAAPAAPAAPTLTAGPSTLTAAWTWVAAGAGVVPLSFTATAYSAPTGGTVVGSPCTASTSPCTITGLTDGEVVHVEVVANAATGSSAPSTRTAGVASGAPGAPTALEVQGGDSVVTASWAPPVSTGGSAITAYRVDAYDAASGGSIASTCQPASLTALHCSLEGLANGSSYFVEAVATNAVGTGPATARSEVRIGARPTVPRSVAVDRGDGTLVVTWTEPISDGGSPITGYLARAYATSSSATVLGSCSTTSTSCTINGIANGTTYYVSVVATSLVGQGQPSTRVAARPSSAPTAPRSVVAARGDGFAAVSWVAPASTNGAIITKYVARAFRTPTDDQPIAECSPADRSLRCNLGPLPNGSTYYVDVVAITARYTSEASSPRVAVLTGTPPSVPREVVASQSGGEVIVRWRVPASDGGQPITSYTATAFSTASGGASRGSCTTGGDSCAISGLVGAPVFISVVATSGLGTGPATTPRVKVVLGGAASEPRQVSAVRDGRRITVSWLRSLDDGGTPITGYRAVVRAGGAILGSCEAATPRGPLSTRVSCRLVARPVVGMTAEVSAVNATTSTGSERVPVTTAQAGTPRLLTVQPAERALIASAARSTADQPGAMYDFRAWSKERGGTVLARCTASRSLGQPSCALTGLRNYVPVWVDARSQNGAAMGAATPRVRAVPMASPPSAPRDVTARWEDGRLVVRWQEPLSDGGYPITATTVTVSDAATGGTVLGTCRAPSGQAHCSVGGLTADYVYVTVVAVNPVGTGPSTAPLGRNRG